MKYLNSTLAILAILGATPALAAEKPALTAVLKSNKDSYPPTASVSSKGPGDRRARLPAASNVDLTLTLTNNSDKEISFNFGGDESQFHFTLKGEGAVTLKPDVAMTEEFRSGKPTAIAAGKSLDIPITSLAGGQRNMTELSYFSKAGDYELSVVLATNANNGNLKLTTDPIKIKVIKPELKE
jgi:hypothetical protein